ncbi:MAG TPA: alternative ribosome rescue aminoacyl-tRNA hydrolase ArfB [Thermoanaerobaculia bacterium]|jgi:ribosome-associated protein|nr:alternative ribosome rescue aminoacyl-tRNA hydrolase ArfB [Thermoanaerobaculia bacterium]
MGILEIAAGLALPEEEISYVTSRSGGPGGQNVNKLETRVTLRFDLAASPSLSEEHKARLRERLATRITRAGVLHVTAQKHRSQGANREAALERFIELLREAMLEETPRKKTRIPRSVHRRRVDDKKRRGQRKQERSGRIPVE